MFRGFAPALLLVATLVPALCILGSPPVLAAGFKSLDTALLHDDNATLAIRSFDRESETEWSVRPVVGRQFHPTSSARITVSGSLDVRLATRARELSRIEPEVTVSWRAKTRVGADAPRVTVAVSAGYQRFRSRVRRGALYEGIVRYDRPIGRRWAVRTEAGYTAREADSEAFDQNAWSVAAVADYRLSPSMTVFGSAGHRDGDVTSIATPVSLAPGNAAVLAGSSARVADDAYSGKIAYRLDASIRSLGVGLRQDVGRKAAIDVSYEYRRGDAGSGLVYRNDRFRAAFRVRL